MVTASTLVVLPSYQPFEIVSWQDAVTEVYCEQTARVMSIYENLWVHSTRQTIPVPAVILREDATYKPRAFTNIVPFNRENLFHRDGGRCFLPETLILMANGTLKTIENIKIGDTLIDGWGNVQSVEYIHKEKISDQVLHIYHRGNGIPIRLTQNHNSITFSRKNKITPFSVVNKPAKKILMTDYLGEVNLKKIWKFDNDENIDLFEMTQDQLRYNIKIYKEKIKYYCGRLVNRYVKVNYELGLFLGLFLAEGSIEKKRIRFTFNIKETYYEAFSKNYVLISFGLKIRTKKYESKHTLVVTLNSRIIRELIKKLCYNIDGKSIVNKTLSESYLKGVLCGILYGDGHLRNDVHKFVIGLKENRLIKDVYAISNILGIYPTISKISNRNDGRKGRQVIYQGNQFNALVAIFDNTYPIKINLYKSDRRKKSDRIFVDRHIVGKVTKIEKIYYRGFVYNLQVSGTHSYIADFVATNNCMYCGKKVTFDDFSFEHVTPRDQGGEANWLNIVVACLKCNNRKRNRTPAGAHMALIRKPFAPKLDYFISKKLVKRIAIRIPHKSWYDYMYWLSPIDP